MEILIKAKFNKKDKVVIKTTHGTEKMDVFVLGEVVGVRQIITITDSFNKITYNISTYKVGEAFSRMILADEGDMYTLDEFTKLFNATH